MQNAEYGDIERELKYIESQQEEFSVVTNRIIEKEKDMQFQNRQMTEMLKESYYYTGDDKESQRLRNEQIEQYEQLIQAQNRFIEDSEEEMRESKEICEKKAAELKEELCLIKERKEWKDDE